MSEPDDKKGLPPDAELPLGYKAPTERDLYRLYFYTSMREVCPKALLRDLHRVVKQHNVSYAMMDFYKMVDVGARFALVELNELKSQRFTVRPHQEHDGVQNFRDGVRALFGPSRTAVRTPYVPRK